MAVLGCVFKKNHDSNRLSSAHPGHFWHHHRQQAVPELAKNADVVHSFWEDDDLLKVTEKSLPLAEIRLCSLTSLGLDGND